MKTTQESASGLAGLAHQPFSTLVVTRADQPDPLHSKRSLKRRIQALGVLVGATLVLVALLGFQLFQMTESARMSDATTQLNVALERLIRQYETAESPSSLENIGTRPLIENDQALAVMTQENLADIPGVEGGFYSHAQSRLLGYAFPTYLGSGPKTDIPEAERPTISRLVSQTIVTKAPAHEQVERGFDAILFSAAPLFRDDQAIGATWLMHRLPGIRNPQWQYHNVSLIALLVMAGLVAGGAWLIACRLDRAIAHTVDGIRTLHETASLPIPATGYAEFDRVVHAINHLAKTVHLQQTRREQLERQLHQADRLAILGRLVAGVAHEVRNPLSSIRLKLQLARRGTLELGKLIGAFDIVEQEISRLDRLVARLLSVARPAASGCQPTDLNQFIGNRLLHWNARASEIGVSVDYAEPRGDASVVSVDRDRLGQILDNLVTNAFDALTETGGTIQVSLVRNEHGSFSLTVSDSGPGISPEARPHLFEPFFTTKPQGTGLGLFLSAEMARASGGTLTYVDSPHGGTCFELALPCRPVEDAAGTVEELLMTQKDA